MSHTNGPWGFTYDGSGTWSIGPADDPQVGTIAHVWSNNHTSAAHEEADAQLIAAAPDLLTALKSLVDVGGGMTLERLTTARAAIAKAEGRP